MPTQQRRTRQRADVLDALVTEGEFVSAQLLHARMSAAGVDVGLTTVYRALAALVDAGRADSIREDNGTRLFRHRPGPQHRHYLLCRCCGRSEPLDAHAVEEWAERLADATGYAGLRHTLEVDGVCGPCSRE